MIDLSNNNGQVNFHIVHTHGHQDFVYLKLSEGDNFHDSTFTQRRHEAQAARMRTGAYHFARPSKNSPREEATFFLRLLPKLTTRDLRPCLDLEDPNANPAQLARWAEEFIDAVRRGCGYRPIIYGSTSYLASCHFHKPPAWLWLAAYGRNDGVEHPFTIPPPWNKRWLAAHQYASTAKVPGVVGNCDLSRVVKRRFLTIHRIHRR